MTLRLSSSSTIDWSKCPKCHSLKSEIRKHVKAFRTLATFNPNLSANIVLKILDQLVGTDEEIAVTNTNNDDDHVIVMESRYHDDDDSSSSTTVHVGTPGSTENRGGSQPSASASLDDSDNSMKSLVSERPRKKNKKKSKGQRAAPAPQIDMKYDQDHSDHPMDHHDDDQYEANDMTETVDNFDEMQSVQDSLSDDVQGRADVRRKKKKKSGLKIKLVLPSTKILDDLSPETPPPPPVADEDDDHILTNEKLIDADNFLSKSENDGSQKFQCLICNRPAGVKRRDARYHVRRVHFEDRLLCPKCSGKFYDTKSLKTHLTKCTGVFTPHQKSSNIGGGGSHKNLSHKKQKFRGGSTSKMMAKNNFKSKMSSGISSSMSSIQKKLQKIYKIPHHGRDLFVRNGTLQNLDITRAMNVRVRLERLKKSSKNLGGNKNKNRRPPGSPILLDQSDPPNSNGGVSPADLKILVQENQGSVSKGGGTESLLVDMEIENDDPEKGAFDESKEEDSSTFLKTFNYQEANTFNASPDPGRKPLEEIYAKIQTVTTPTLIGNQIRPAVESKNSYECLECHKQFGKRFMAVRHVRGVHFKEGQVTCHQCGAIFCTKSTLIRHSKSVHVHAKSFEDTLDLSQIL